jgi:hypothetical protein
LMTPLPVDQADPLDPVMNSKKVDLPLKTDGFCTLSLG